MTYTRRDFLTIAGVSAVGLMATGASTVTPKQPICLFSKHLHWLSTYGELAETVAELGFDGLDLTVRAGGHVQPNRVETDLPKAIQALNAVGISVPMIVTDLTRADTQAERVLRTAQQVGVQFFRPGYYQYDLNARIGPQLIHIQQQLTGLGQLAEKVGLMGSCQNHSGRGYFGGPVWDLAEVLDSNTQPGRPQQGMGAQYDIFHAQIEGRDTWEAGFERIARYINTVVIKDFRWTLVGKQAEKQACPLGEGVIDWPAYLARLRQQTVTGPISLHAEYPLGGADEGKTTLTIPTQQVKNALKQDLARLRAFLNR